LQCFLKRFRILVSRSILIDGNNQGVRQMTITIETIQPLNIFFKKQENNAATRFETSFENWRKLGEIIAEVIAITGGKELER
jgi:hypothetical protein